jgi:hypothetical protein
MTVIEDAFRRDPFLKGVIAGGNPFPYALQRTNIELGGIQPDHAGAMAYSTTDNVLVVWNGTNWIKVATDGAI